MATAAIATRTIGSPIPAPLEAFEPIKMPDTHVPQLATDRVVAKMQHDPQAFALDYLNLLYMAKVNANENKRLREASLRQWERLRAIEARLDGKAGEGVQHEKGIERIREDVSFLMGRAS